MRCWTDCVGLELDELIWYLAKVRGIWQDGNVHRMGRGDCKEAAIGRD